MSPEARKRKRDQRWMAVALFVLIAAVFYQSYNGRLDLWHSQIKACHRNQLDRIANADGWHAAWEARMAAAKVDNGKARRDDIETAHRYERIVADLNSRVEARNPHFSCTSIYPKPSLTG